MNKIISGISVFFFLFATLTLSAQDGIGKFDFYGKKANPKPTEIALQLLDEEETPAPPAGDEDEAGFKITRMPFNSEYSDMCPTLYGGGVMFSSARKRGFFTKVVDKTTGDYFYDVYFVPLAPGKQKTKLVKGKVNTRFHDGPADVSRDGKLIYFTRSNYVDGKFKRSKDGVNKLVILQAENNGKKWKEVTTLDINSNEYSVAHPTISNDGNVLYFASDMPGGFGGFDIWMIKKKENGEWTKPSNLGSRINTSKNEYFPSIHESGMLFFASDGHKGKGGLDLFYASGSETAWDPAKNMGDINSPQDDFGITWIKNKPSGFFTSNREGNDDIYRFDKKLTISIEVLQAGSGMKLPGANVTITDINSRKTRLKTDNLGQVNFFGKLNQEYMIEVEREYHEPAKMRFSTRDVSPVEDQQVQVELVREYRLVGNVKNAGNGTTLSGVNIRLIDGVKEKTKVTDEKGNHIWKLEPGKDYTVIISNPGYVPQVVHISTKGKAPVDDIILNTRLAEGAAALVEGTTRTKSDGKPLAGVNVRAVNEDKQEEYKATTSFAGGKFWMVLDTGANYSLIGSSEGYFSARVEMPVQDSSYGGKTVSAEIEMIESKVGETVAIIYYDYNKSDITKTSSKELFEIVYFLKDNPDAEVELGAHTDARGGDRFNERLSARRADQAVNFIVRKGQIDNKRISAKGYGESQLANRCRDGVECSDEEHSLNRRAEIHVTKLNGQSATESEQPESER